MSIEKKDKLYEGKAKIMYKTSDPDLLIQYFKDDATAGDGAKKGQIIDKGVMNNAIATAIFEMLEKNGIKTHYVERLSDREMLVKNVRIVLLEAIVRNILAGSLAKKMGREEGTPLKIPTLELGYKSDELHDPMLNDDHVVALEIATEGEIARIRELSHKVNGILKPYFAERGIKLVDFKLEFGWHKDELLLADEFSPDGSRLWNMEDDYKLDKDRFRRDLGNIEEAYQEVYKRVVGEGS